MNCKLIHEIFERNESLHYSFDRDARIEATLEMGRIKRIGITFLTSLCHHPDNPSLIHWREIPILRITCFGHYCEFIILKNKLNILFYLIHPIIQQTNVRYIALLIDVRLPWWNDYHELILVLNCVGKLLLIPTEITLSSLELKKINKIWEIRVNNLLKLKNEPKLLDIIAPNDFSWHDFRIFI
ncbi:MAG: hypothetical protein ACFFB2_16340 [Promethearchaeota archaeon]